MAMGEDKNLDAGEKAPMEAAEEEVVPLVLLYYHEGFS